MVLANVFQTLQDTLVSVFGNLAIVAILLMGLFFIGFMFIGLQFRYSLLITAPLVLVFSQNGWFPQWVGGLFWILIVGIGGYIAWTYIKGER